MNSLKKVDISTRLSQLKANIPEKVSSVKLLELVILLYLQSPKQFSVQNFEALKQALYVWCVCYPYWNPQELSTANIKDSDIKLTYSEFLTVQEVSYQITRFLDFGEMYWRDSKYVWDTQPRTPRNLVTNLILEKMRWMNTR